MKLRHTSSLATLLLLVGLVSTGAAQRTSDPSRWANASDAFAAPFLRINMEH